MTHISITGLTAMKLWMLKLHLVDIKCQVSAGNCKSKLHFFTNVACIEYWRNEVSVTTLLSGPVFLSHWFHTHQFYSITNF